MRSSSSNLANDVNVRVLGSSVKFLVNATEVTSRATAKVDTGGILGIRVHDDEDVHIAYLAVQKAQR